jgi:hypothetical protein
MTALGWIFMLVSVGFVWTLAIWCFRRVLSSPVPPPEEVQDFHSA